MSLNGNSKRASGIRSVSDKFSFAAHRAHSAALRRFECCMPDNFAVDSNFLSSGRGLSKFSLTFKATVARAQRNSAASAGVGGRERRRINHSERLIANAPRYTCDLADTFRLHSLLCNGNIALCFLNIWLVNRLPIMSFCNATVEHSA